MAYAFFIRLYDNNGEAAVPDQSEILDNEFGIKKSDGVEWISLTHDGNMPGVWYVDGGLTEAGNYKLGRWNALISQYEDLPYFTGSAFLSIGDVGAIAAEYQTLTSNYDSLISAISEVQNTQDEMVQEIDDIKGSNWDASKNISDMHADMETMKGAGWTNQSIVSASNLAATAYSVQTGLNTKIVTHTSQINDLTTDLTSLDTSVRGMDSALQAISTSDNWGSAYTGYYNNIT